MCQLQFRGSNDHYRNGPDCISTNSTILAADGVVDGEGRVHGLDEVRVVDASIMPRSVTANLSATVYMMAEKMSDAIRCQ